MCFYYNQFSTFSCIFLFLLSFRRDETIVYPSINSMLEFAWAVEEEAKPPESIDPETDDICRRLIHDVENFYDLHDQVGSPLFEDLSNVLIVYNRRIVKNCGDIGWFGSAKCPVSFPNCFSA